MRVDTKIVFLSGLEVKISPKTRLLCGHFVLASKKFFSRMPSWHPPDSDSGSVQDDESIIKVCNYAKTRVIYMAIWHLVYKILRDRISDL